MLRRAFLILFIVYGAFELTAGIMQITQSAETINAQFGSDVLTPPALIYVQGFGNGLLTLGVLSLLAVFIRHATTRAVLAGGFALFNVLAAYSCLTVPNIPTAFSAAGYVHALFAVLFAVAAFVYWQDSQELFHENEI